MKLFLQPREIQGDYVLLLHSDALPDLPSHCVGSKHGALPEDSPALQCEAYHARKNPLHGWFYYGDDAEAIYQSAVMPEGEEEFPGHLERDYEAVREAYKPDLKPYRELSHEEKVRHYNVYMDTQRGFQAIGEAIRGNSGK